MRVELTVSVSSFGPAFTEVLGSFVTNFSVREPRRNTSVHSFANGVLPWPLGTIMLNSVIANFGEVTLLMANSVTLYLHHKL